MNIPGIGRAARNVGAAVAEVAEVFTVNRTKAEQAAHERYKAALGQAGAEFAHARQGWFDRMVDGLNRLPRPLLAYATIGLFAYAMTEPDGFARRMQGLSAVPEPLWWLLGAIVSFYFGARELAHYRGEVPGPRAAAPPGAPVPAAASDFVIGAPKDMPPDAVALDLAPESSPAPDPGNDNPALAEWRQHTTPRG
jgi:hypothetical protein